MPEGLEAFAATCRSALERIDEFPGFIFTCSSAAHYAFVEETDPNLFARIQNAVRAERWAIVGGWWVEPDCNLPSGESFIRQALLGQRYFESRFGKIATVGYNIDSFGHNANIPQLLKKAGMDAYIFMRPKQDEKELSAALFEWEAPSGDRVTTYRLPLHYSNYEQSIRDKVANLLKLSHFRSDVPWMLFFGVGNHGGGPTIAELKDITSLLTERNDIQFSDSERFFESVDRVKLPVFRDEMQPHAIGCYSAHSEIKQLHRRTERVVLQAERAEVLAYLWTPTHAAHVRTKELERAWENLCFNEFHDLLGGVAIREACDDAISMYREAISLAERVTRTGIQRLASRIDTFGSVQNIIVFNLAAHEREEFIEFELWQPDDSGFDKQRPGVQLISSNGVRIDTQRIESSGKIGNDRARFLAKVKVPALGWSSFGVERVAGIDEECHSERSDSERSGELGSQGIFGVVPPIEGSSTPFVPAAPKRTTLGMTGIPNSEFYSPAIILRDETDTWSHGIRGFTDFEEPFRIDSEEIIESGPLRYGIRKKSSGLASRLEEEVYWEPESLVIEIRYFLEWHEQHKMLKLRFRHGCKVPVARYEIPYAWIERPIGPNEWPGQSWVNVSERDGPHGLAIITDSKYSYSVDEEYIYVVAARSPLFAHHIPPHEFHAGERERYQDQGEQEFRILVIPHEGNWSGSILTRIHSPLIVHQESGHEGTLPKSFQGFERTSRAIHIGAMKMAEDGNGILVRAVEQAGEKSDAEFRFPTLGAKWQTSFSPFEIKSFLIQNNPVTEVDFLERPV